MVTGSVCLSLDFILREPRKGLQSSVTDSDLIIGREVRSPAEIQRIYAVHFDKRMSKSQKKQGSILIAIFSNMDNIPKQFRYSFVKTLSQNYSGVIDLLLTHY